ncbi:MAG: phage portal protein [Blautia sp.]
MRTLKFSIRNFIRKWVRKLLPRNSIEKEMKVQIAVSGMMDDAIQLWKDMYENHPPWAGKEGTLCTNIPATIAEEMARLILAEFELEVTGSPMADFINKQLNREFIDLDVQVERYCAKGGIVLKPYVSVGVNGLPRKIEIDFVEADKFYPTAFNSKGEIMSAIFLQNKRIGEFLYTRLEYHDFSGSSVTIMNKAYRSEKITSYNDDEEPNISRLFDEEVPLSEVDEWAGLSETPVTIGNVEKPLFVYIKTAKSNNIDSSSPLGVSIYSKAVELIQEADRMLGQIVWEYDAKEAAVHISEEFLKNDKDGKPILPEGKEKLYRSFDEGSGNKTLFDVYSPDIRDNPMFNGLNKILKRIEWNVGFAYGTISDPNELEKTAEEIKSSKQRSYRTVSRLQSSWQKGIENLVDAMVVLVNLYRMVPSGQVDVNCTWGDSVLEDTDKEYQRRWQMVVAGKLKPEKFIAWYFGCTEEEALEYMPEVLEEEFPPEE